MKFHEGEIPCYEDGARGRHQGIEKNPWEFQGWGESGRVGEGIGPFHHIFIDVKGIPMNRYEFYRIDCVR